LAYDDWISISRRGDAVLGRRAFIVSVAGSLIIARSVAGAQSVLKVNRIRFVAGTSPIAEPRLWEGFFQGMRELGYIEGRNFVIEGRYYEDRIERLPPSRRSSLGSKVDLIVPGAPPAPEAAQRATSTIPAMNVQIQLLQVRAPGEFAAAFAAMTKTERAD